MYIIHYHMVILVSQEWSLRLAVKPPGHLIHVDKWFLKMYHTCVFAGLAIYGHSDQHHH